MDKVLINFASDFSFMKCCSHNKKVQETQSGHTYNDSEVIFGVTSPRKGRPVSSL